MDTHTEKTATTKRNKKNKRTQFEVHSVSRIERQGRLKYNTVELN